MSPKNQRLTADFERSPEMLVRVVLALSDPATTRRVRALVPRGDAYFPALKAGPHVWERILRQIGDVVIIARELLPEPAPESVVALRSLPESPRVIVLSQSDDPGDTARLIAAGCTTVLSIGLPDSLLGEAVRTVVARQRELHSERLNTASEFEQPRLLDFISKSPGMQAFIATVERVAHSDATLLITGETGVGKEHLARAIHAESGRSNGPFVAINCGALPEALLESELFGHEEGAFTGATRARRGWFELAHHGTIFLDEVAEMPHHLQVKLLRVLQNRKVQRVGGDAEVPIDVRVVTATNRDLKEELEANRFRPDLYYRLGVIELNVPPLRERVEDIPDIIRNYIEHFQHRFATAVEGISPEARSALEAYSWPGNVRELINIIERAMLLSDGPNIELIDLPDELRTGVDPATARGLAPMAGEANWLEHPLSEVRGNAVADLERRYLAALLAETKGRVGETAERAGIPSRTLFEKMKEYGLKKEDFKVR